MLALHERLFRTGLFIQGGGPVHYQRQGDRCGVLLGRGEQETLAVGSDVVGVADRAGCAYYKKWMRDSGF